MHLLRILGRAINTALRPMGLHLVRQKRDERPWDSTFREWIASAKTTGQDPNDIGDTIWSRTRLQTALERYYLPHINPASVVLELGPGTGRLTRHVLPRCREMLLVDYSSAVCAWLEAYLRGKGRYRIYHIEEPQFPAIANSTVDAIVAHGVFEHIELEDLSRFFEEFYRVLRPGGVAAFDFDNIMSNEGLELFRQSRGKPGERSIFRFYHSAVLTRIAQSAGFEVFDLAEEGRFGYLRLRKPTPNPGAGPSRA